MAFSCGCRPKTDRQCSRAAAARAASAWRSSQPVCPAGSEGVTPAKEPLASTASAPDSQALPKEKRLAKRREFLRVYESGRKLFSRYCVLFFAANDLTYSRVGVTATKKSGKANVRNRLKRWTREVYRHQRGPLALDRFSIDVVVNVKPNAAKASWGDFHPDLERALSRIASESAIR